MKRVSKETRIIIAGFGGQGVVMAGRILAEACIREGINVTAMVSYGAEMRGGTANCTLVISRSEVTSPIVEHPDAAVIMNQPSLEKFAPDIVEGGLMILNKSLAGDGPRRNDISIVEVEASREAVKLGDVRVANVVCLGALVRKTSLLKMESVASAIEEVFGAKGGALIKLNREALYAGAALLNRR